MTDNDYDISAISSSPLRGVNNKKYDGTLYSLHWFDKLPVPDDKGKTHQCKRCDSKVTWLGPSKGYKCFGCLW